MLLWACIGGIPINPRLVDLNSARNDIERLQSGVGDAQSRLGSRVLPLKRSVSAPRQCKLQQRVDLRNDVCPSN